MSDSLRAKPVSRRRFVAGGLGAASAAVLPTWIQPPPALADADTDINAVLAGIVSFVFPGNDRFSRQQQEWTWRPGGVAAGGTESLRDTLDRAIAVPFIKTPGALPGAAAVATVLELFARDAYKGRSYDGPLFPRLIVREKATVLGNVDRSELFSLTPLRYALNALPTLAAEAAFSEAGVRNNNTVPRTISRRPVGWNQVGYKGPCDGWPEMIGYWKGRTAADGYGG